MRVKTDEKSKKAPPVAPTVVKAPDYSLAVLAREIARIQKKLGIDFSWYKS